MTGQPYSISAMLKLPQSSRNQLQGMFISCMKVMKRDMMNIITNSCKSNTLGIKSDILMWMESIFYSPLLISESQWITVEYFEDFIDYPGDQADSLVVEIQSQSLEVETVIIMIHAQLFGLRYIMHHFPLVSLFSGVFTRILIVSVIVIISCIILFAGDRDFTNENFDQGQEKLPWKVGVDDTEDEIISESQEEIFIDFKEILK